MRTVHTYAALISLAAALIITGCKKPAVDDATVTAAVQTRIAGDAALGPGSIQSSVQSGVATLNGAVSNEAARALAAKDAAEIAGVRTVINNLTVEDVAAAPPQNPPFTPPANEPAATVTTRPDRVAPIPVRHSAAIGRQRVQSNNTPAPPPTTAQAAPVERAAPPQPASQPAPPQPASQPAPPPPPAFRNVDLQSGTSIPVRITQTLDSATAQQGQTFSGTVASDVLADGLVAIPQGTPVYGRIVAVQEAAHFKGNSLLSVEVTGISRRGERIPLSTQAYTREGASRGKNTAIKTGAGAAAGAILGGIFGGGKGAAIGAAAGGGTGAGINGVTRGEQVQIPSETLIQFRLTNSVNLRVPARGERRSSDSDFQNNHPQENQPDNPNRRPLN